MLIMDSVSPPLRSFSPLLLSSFNRFSLSSTILVLLLISTFLSSLPNSVTCECKNPPVIFNFGDSNSDTGGLVAGLGYSINLPNGRTFFRRSAGRLSDGRLIIDFLCKLFLYISSSFTKIAIFWCINLFFTHKKCNASQCEQLSIC